MFNVLVSWFQIYWWKILWIWNLTLPTTPLTRSGFESFDLSSKPFVALRQRCYPNCSYRYALKSSWLTTTAPWHDFGRWYQISTKQYGYFLKNHLCYFPDIGWRAAWNQRKSWINSVWQCSKRSTTEHCFRQKTSYRSNSYCYTTWLRKLTTPLSNAHT